MTPFQRDYLRMQSNDIRRRGLATNQDSSQQYAVDEEAPYDEPFPYYPYMPDHVTIDIGEAMAVGATSVGNCYNEICRDIAVIVQIFLWACVVHCETLVQFVVWCLVSIASYKALGQIGAVDRRPIRRIRIPQQATAG